MAEIIKIEGEQVLRYLHDIEVECGHYPWSLEMLKDAFDYGDTFFAYDDFCGYCCLSLVDDVADIMSIGILPKFQGQALGERLCRHAIEYCKANHIKQIFLETATHNTRAINLYKKLGFLILGIRKNYYDDGTDAYVMKLEL